MKGLLCAEFKYLWMITGLRFGPFAPNQFCKHRIATRFSEEDKFENRLIINDKYQTAYFHSEILVQ